MKLTRLQAATLRRLLIYRDRPPTLGERLRLAAPLWLLALLLGVAAGYLMLRMQLVGGLFLLVGLCLGAILRDVGYQRGYVQWWPLNREITDWSRVDQLLSAPPEAEDPSPTRLAAVRKTRWGYAVLAGLAVATVVLGAAIAAERALVYLHDPTRNNPRDNVIILTASWCGYCMKLRNHLTELNVGYTDLDVEKTTEGRWAYAAVRATGVPVTIVGDEVIRGIGSGGSLWQRVDGALEAAGYLIPAPPDPPGIDQRGQ